MLKRVLPFSITLIVGAMLGSLTNQVDVHRRMAAGVSLEQQMSHSKTWVIVRSLPSPDYAERYPDDWQRFSRLRVLLDANGNVSKIVPTLTTVDVLPQEIINAARNIDFTPATRDGRPVSIWIDVEYKLQQFWPHDHYGLSPVIITASSEAGEPWRVIHE